MSASPRPTAAGAAANSATKLVALPIGTVLAGKFKLIELTLEHPILGLTYTALNQQGDGFIVRADAEKNALSLVRSEAGFLQSILELKATERFVEIMHGAKYENYVYFVTRFRPGPSLNVCLGAMSAGRFSVDTAARVAYQILKAIECVHTLKYLLRRIDPNAIHFDVSTRAIFLSDTSSVRIDPLHVGLDVSVRWSGAQLYAPIAHHNGGSMRARHDIEALIFLLVDMTTAQLPWESVPADMLGSVKRRTITDQTLFVGCPPQYAAAYTYVSCLADTDAINYARCYKTLEEVWRQAGVSSLDEKYDFEANMRAS